MNSISDKKPRYTVSTQSPPLELEHSTANNKDTSITALPSNVMQKIFLNLNFREAGAVRSVCKEWRKVIDQENIQANLLYRHCHPVSCSPSLQNSVAAYDSYIRDTLNGFGSKGERLIKKLDNSKTRPQFNTILFLAISKLLNKTKSFSCENSCSIPLANMDDRSFPFSPDGNHLLTYNGTDDHNTAYIWKRVGQEWPFNEPITHSKRILCACFSPDGNYLVTSSDDKTAKIRRLVDGKWEANKTIQHDKGVFHVSFSPDGNNLVTLDNKEAKIFRLVDSQWQHKATTCHNYADIMSSLECAIFSPDGNHFVMASKDNTTHIWELIREEWQHKTTTQHSSKIKYLSFSPDENHFVTAYNDNTTVIWRCDGKEWQKSATITHDKEVLNVSFSPDGNHLVSSDYTSAQICGLVDGEWQQQASISHNDRINSALFSPDGNHLVTASVDQTAQIWGRFEEQWQLKATINHKAMVNNACFSPDGNHVVTASDDNNAYIWGQIDGIWQHKGTIRHNGWVANASFSPDGCHIITIAGCHIITIAKSNDVTAIDYKSPKGTAQIWRLKSESE